MPRRTPPGGYIEEIPAVPAAISPAPTAIPAFVGYTEKAGDPAGALTRTPTRIDSLADYEQNFGGAQPETGITVAVRVTATGIRAAADLPEAARSKHILCSAVRLFFANGGSSAYIVSVGPYRPLGTDLVAAELEQGIGALAGADGPSLIVIPEAQSLSLAGFKALQEAALGQCHDRQDRFVVMDVHGGGESLSDPHADLLRAVAAFRADGPDRFLAYGAAYAPNLETTLPHAYDESAVQVTVDGDAAVPLDSLDEQTRTHAVAAIRELPMRLPPSAAIAGVYAKVDAERGVWKAPAGISLAAVIRPTIEISSVQQDLLNVDPVGGKSLNAIRRFAGRGTLVWGARTLAGNDDQWRYVSVRRFATFVEKSVGPALDQFVFEPNDANTWARVQVMIEDFLTGLWRQGALQGTKPQHAFFVAVGLGRTMTEVDVLEGRMIVETGLAVLRPAEFLILRFSVNTAGP